jgi:DNA-binding response OmpR family regulator
MERTFDLPPGLHQIRTPGESPILLVPFASAFGNFVFDLILLDWNMPNMDGLTFLKTIKADDTFKNIPVIMVTSESEKTRIIEAIKAGAVNYVVKPFSKEVILEKIQTVLSNKALAVLFRYCSFGRSNGFITTLGTGYNFTLSPLTYSSP